MGFEGRKHPFTRITSAVGLMVTVGTVALVSHMAPDIAIAYAASTTNAQTIELPLYPGAGKQPYATIVYGASASPYLKAGSARFVVRANVYRVKSWYLSAMTTHGYRLQSTSPTGGMDGLGQQLEFVEKRNSGLDVILNFQNLSNQPHDTVIEYTVADMEVPPRSADSLVSSHVKKVLIQYEPASTSGASSMIQRTFTKLSMVTTLVHTVNALPVDIRSSLYGPTEYQGGATLQFVDSAGHVIVVKVEMGVNRVVVGRTSPLFDIQNHVWQLVSADMGFAPYPPRG